MESSLCGACHFVSGVFFALPAKYIGGSVSCKLAQWGLAGAMRRLLAVFRITRQTMVKLCQQWVRYGFLALALGGFVILGAGCSHSDKTSQSKSKVAAKAATAPAIPAKATTAPATPAKAASASATPAKTATTSSVPAKTVTTVAPPSAAETRLQTMSVHELLSNAQKALKDDRLVAPAGNNAIEYYLKVLEKQPDSRVAQDALRETFPFAAQATDQAINQKNFPEAQREIGLLAKADPTNYTLTILRSKLDAQRKLVIQQQNAQQQATQQKLAAQQASKKAQEAQHSPQQSSAEAAAAAKVAEQKAATEAAARLRQQSAAQQQLAAQRAARNHGAVVSRLVPPKFPLSAARQGLQGWVDVQFTVEADGSVDNVHVVRSNPPRAFDRAAIIAVKQWRFKPAVINGRPTATVHKRQIQFTLPKAP